MKLLIAALLACIPVRADAGSCQDSVDKGGEYVFSHEEPIEGGKRCFVKHKDGGDPVFHTIVWDNAPPPANDKPADDKKPAASPPPPKLPEGPCEKEVTLPRLTEMWDVIAGARKNSKSKVPAGTRTYAVAFVFDASCKYTAQAVGEFTNGKHAERIVLDQLDAKHPIGKQLQPKFTVFWMTDQVPCTDGNKLPKEGYCTVNLKEFAKSRNVGQRVFVAAEESKVKGIMKSPKSFVKHGKAPTEEQLMELTEFTVKPK